MRRSIRACLWVALASAPHSNVAGQVDTDRSVMRAANALRAGDAESAARIASEILSEQESPEPNALWIRGNALEDLERYTEAVLDFERLAEIDPGRTGFLVALGEARFKAGNMSGSIAAFDVAVELDKTLAPRLWQRGISHYYAGRLGDCIHQFETHRTVNPQDVENSAWHFLCLAARDGFNTAREHLMPVDRDSRVPMAEILALFRGTGSEGAVIKAAERASMRGMGDTPLFYAHLYIGLFKEAAGDGDASAEHLRKAVSFRDPGNYMWQVGRIHRSLRTAGR